MNDNSHHLVGKTMSFKEMIESALTMLRDDQAAEGDPTACDHFAAFPRRGTYICGTCHTEVSLREIDELWMNLENAVLRIETEPTLGDLFRN